MAQSSRKYDSPIFCFTNHLPDESFAVIASIECGVTVLARTCWTRRSIEPHDGHGARASSAGNVIAISKAFPQEA
jgi:hypothetical protein